MECHRITRLDASVAQILTQSRSIFSQQVFAAIWRHHGGRPVWWVVSEQRQPVAVLPVVEFGRGPLTRLQAMPDGCYADIIGDAHDGVTDVLLYAMHEHGYLKAFVYDFDSRFPMQPAVSVNEQVTRTVDISAADWEPPDSNLRSEIRKAERDGVTVRRINPSTDIGQVVLLAERTAESHSQSVRYGVAFMQSLAALSTDSPLIRWYVALHGGAIVASHIYLVHNDQLLYWQAYLDRDAAQLRPNQLLTSIAIEEARTDGIMFLNLGATPDDAEGLTFYKQRWGGSEHQYRSLQWQSRLGRLV